MAAREDPDAATDYGVDGIRACLAMVWGVPGNEFVVEEMVDAGDKVSPDVFSGRGPAPGPGGARAGAGRDLSRREDRSDRGVLRPLGGARSRRAVGVGDVAGERGDRARRGYEAWQPRATLTLRPKTLRRISSSTCRERSAQTEASTASTRCDVCSGGVRRGLGVGSGRGDEFIDAGEHVVMPFTNRLRGRDGIEVQARGTWLCTIRDGLIVRICLYQEVRGSPRSRRAAGVGERRGYCAGDVAGERGDRARRSYEAFARGGLDRTWSTSTDDVDYRADDTGPIHGKRRPAGVLRRTGSTPSTTSGWSRWN